MKVKFLSLLFAIAFVGSMNADCTVKTSCGERTYAENSISVSTQNGAIVVTNSSGVEIDRIECDEAVFSMSCVLTGDGGNDDDTDNGDDTDLDFCDSIPDFFKPFFDCE